MTPCVAEVCMAYLSLSTAGISPSLHDECVIDGHADNDFCSSLGQLVIVGHVSFQVCLHASTRQVSQVYKKQLEPASRTRYKNLVTSWSERSWNTEQNSFFALEEICDLDGLVWCSFLQLNVW
jgi:hypothetical protein